MRNPCSVHGRGPPGGAAAAPARPLDPVARYAFGRGRATPAVPWWGSRATPILNAMKTLDTTAKVRAHERRRQVVRIFQEQEWGNVELLDGWDGVDLGELRPLLDEDDYERLLLALETPRER